MASNGWSNGVDGPPGQPAASLPYWEAGNPSLGRGRGGFAPGRGRGFGAKWAQQVEEKPVGYSRSQDVVNGWAGGRTNGVGAMQGGKGFGRPPEPMGSQVETWGAPLGPPVHTGNGGPHFSGAQRNKQNSACYKCGADGHISKECGNPRLQQGYGAGGDRRNGSRGEGCYNCGEQGHFARECKGEYTRKNRGEETSGEQKRKMTEDRMADPYIPDESLEENLYEHGVGSGVNFQSALMRQNAKVTGIDPPTPIRSFGMMGLDQRVFENIMRSKYKEPTPVQKYAIPMILAGRDVMGCAQTGSGKTAAYLIPIVQRLLQAGVGGRSRSRQACPEVVIMSPTRELAIQIKDEARKFCNGSDLQCMVVYGGTSTAHQAAKLEEGCNILVATPGRLHDYVERGKVSYCELQFLVLDEADRMLDMGFKDEIVKMVRNPNMPGKGSRRTMMFSATFPDEIQKMAFEFLSDDYLFLGIGRVGGACKDVAQKFEQVEQYDKREKLLNIFRESQGNIKKTLVFVEVSFLYQMYQTSCDPFKTKKTADFLASYMCQSKVSATSIHGDRQQREREEALKTFKMGETPVLVATAVAARGLDIKGVEHVVNYDLPTDIDEYVHRIGRTGRVGNTGAATSFYDRGKDGGLAKPLLDILAEAQQPVPNWLEAEARRNPEGHHGTGGGQRFGGRDIRTSGPGFNHNSAGPGFVAPGQPLERDDGWD